MCVLIVNMAKSNRSTPIIWDSKDTVGGAACSVDGGKDNRRGPDREKVEVISIYMGNKILRSDT